MKIWSVITLQYLFLLPIPYFFSPGDDNDADEDEGHTNREHDKDIGNEKVKLDDENQISKSDPANGEITIPILRRNGPLLQSQWVSNLSF